jgi:Zn-dependent M28 family amino/carboxypeptidase
MTERLRQAGWPVREHHFLARPPGRDPVPMTNLIAELPGERDEWIQLGAHYDTKDLPGVEFVGANDGASGVALLLELARQLGSSDRPYGVRLMFFDGEEAFGSRITVSDGLYGSRALAAELARSGELEAVRAMILVDMVADADLDLVEELGSSPRLRRLAREVATELGIQEVVWGGPRMSVVDDHVPFAQEGLREVLCLIDFRYGDRTVPGPYWHTSRDRLDAVSAESLNTVGTLVVELYGRIVRADAGDSASPK